MDDAAGDANLLSPLLPLTGDMLETLDMTRKQIESPAILGLLVRHKYHKTRPPRKFHLPKF